MFVLRIVGLLILIAVLAFAGALLLGVSGLEKEIEAESESSGE